MSQKRGIVRFNRTVDVNFLRLTVVRVIMQNSLAYVAVHLAFRAVYFQESIATFGKRRHRQMRRFATLELQIYHLVIDCVVIGAIHALSNLVAFSVDMIIATVIVLAISYMTSKKSGSNTNSRKVT